MSSPLEGQLIAELNYGNHDLNGVHILATEHVTCTELETKAKFGMKLGKLFLLILAVLDLANMYFSDSSMLSNGWLERVFLLTLASISPTDIEMMIDGRLDAMVLTLVYIPSLGSLEFATILKAESLMFAWRRVVGFPLGFWLLSLIVRRPLAAALFVILLLCCFIGAIVMLTYGTAAMDMFCVPAITTTGIALRYIRRVVLSDCIRDADESDSSDVCAVCMEGWESANGSSTTSEVTELPCAHKFHLKCIDSWLARNSSCPICRKKYPGMERDVKPFKEQVMEMQKRILDWRRIGAQTAAIRAQLHQHTLLRQRQMQQQQMAAEAQVSGNSNANDSRVQGTNGDGSNLEHGEVTQDQESQAGTVTSTTPDGEATSNIHSDEPRINQGQGRNQGGSALTPGPEISSLQETTLAAARPSSLLSDFISSRNTDAQTSQSMHADVQASNNRSDMPSDGSTLLSPSTSQGTRLGGADDLNGNEAERLPHLETPESQTLNRRLPSRHEQEVRRRMLGALLRSSEES